MTPELTVVEPVHSNKISATVGDLALKIFEKQFSKFIRWDSAVLADLEPEPLHQMRVASRRLQTALQLFKPFLGVTPSFYPDFAQVAKRLGRVRDLDVLELWLQQYQAQSQTQANLSVEEQTQLHWLLNRMAQLRQKRFKRLTKTLTGSIYGDLMRHYQDWLDAPNFHRAAQWQTTLALPDLLMPLVHTWLNHPGWLVEASPNGAAQAVENASNPDAIFHDLRKLTKQVRYQTEFFTAFYGPELSVFITDLKAIQDLLGAQQDHVVFAAFLQKMLGKKWQAKVPTLAETLQQANATFQAQWQPLREIYLSPEGRGERRSRLLSPTA